MSTQWLRPSFCNTRYSMRADFSAVGARLTTALLAIGVMACGGRGGQTRVVIPPGSSMRAAAESLSKAGVIGSAKLFRVYAMLRGRDRGIKAGTYMLPRNESWNSVIEALRAGKGIVQVVTVPEGFSISQIAPLLATKLGQSEDSVDAAARDTAWIHRLAVPIPFLEGYLFPDTYTYPDGTSARAAVNAMLRRFEQVWRPEWTARLDSIGMTRHQVLTLASIVETEARLPQERPIIAAVYLNRLRDGMLLEADPTVQYARGRHVARVLYKDLAVESPYNTYRNPGLPPGPIASPGRASIIAALYPASVPYKFFVAYPDGHHEFRNDLAGHMLAKAAARRAWDTLEAARRPTPTPPAAPPSGKGDRKTKRSR
jgi:UPF0755 protein